MIEPLEFAPDLLALHRSAPRRYPCLLESVAAGTARGRYDFLFYHDGEGLQLSAEGSVRTLSGALRGDSFLAALDADFVPLQRAVEAGDVPFQGGWVLLLGYELAMEIEPRLSLPRHSSAMPIALALRCPAAIVIDHESASVRVVAENGCPALLESIRADLAVSTAKDVPAEERVASHQQIREDDPDRFVTAVERIHQYIRAGDVFQVNLSRGWSVPGFGGDPAQLYASLRKANPAPFSALLRMPDWAIVSSSPERLVSRRGERIETRPIAGTRPRLPDDDDQARVSELIANPKERAEHIMLIDLERNDLGRVSVAGSVHVDELMAVESYAHVHHIESTVSGRARPGLTPGTLIRAVFPGGTITGCPKVRCMEIIAEIENVARGAYTGAIGWLDRSGDLDLNILIRTLSVDRGELRFRAGAGIVADSDAARELAETRAKARGILQALGS